MSLRSLTKFTRGESNSVHRPEKYPDIFDTNSEYRSKVRIGHTFQAVCPDMIPLAQGKVDSSKSLESILWSPLNEISDDDLLLYINMSKDEYKYTEEQALGLLFWHNFKIKDAENDLKNFTPLVQEWSEEEKKKFNICFEVYGKNFDKIATMLPSKTMLSIIDYYYTTKSSKKKRYGRKQRTQDKTINEVVMK